MENKDILKAVLGIEKSIRSSEDQLNILVAELKEEEVIASLHGWKTLSTSKIQREFQMGYASTSKLVSNLIEKGLIERIGDSLNYKILKKSK